MKKKAENNLYYWNCPIVHKKLNTVVNKINFITIIIVLLRITHLPPPPPTPLSTLLLPTLLVCFHKSCNFGENIHTFHYMSIRETLPKEPLHMFSNDTN